MNYSNMTKFLILYVFLIHGKYVIIEESSRLYYVILFDSNTITHCGVSPDRNIPPAISQVPRP